MPLSTDTPEIETDQRERLAADVRLILRAADDCGLHEVAIHLNAALVALDGAGVAPADF